MAPYDRRLGLDDKVFRRTNSAIASALRDGACLTRTEVKAVLARASVGALDVQRAAHIMMRAELDAVICSGPRRGKQFTYALLDDRVPPAAKLDRDEALPELTRRYFRTHSPATARDFAWWSGLTMADVKRGLDLARRDLEPVSVDGLSYWTAGPPAPRPKPSAHLLPNYDEFFIGHRDRSAIGRRVASVKAVTGGNFLITHVVVIDGQLVGSWRRASGRDAIRLDLKLLTRITSAERDRLLREVRRYEAFAGRPVVLHGLRYSAAR